ncbi:MAG: hypothetical protein LBC64_08095 [Fibromonadaceae bacterium]|jgi:hypothetical protein|nr:hypothetical protein [Fibromonadaceae bacterium]
MENLFKLLAQIAIELKLSKGINATEEEKNSPAPVPIGHLIAVLTVAVGFLILAFV